MPGRFAVHGLDDVAALAHAAERILQPHFQPPLAGAKFLGQAEPLQLLQPAHAQALLEGVAVSRGDETSIVHVTDEAAIDAGQALLLDLAAQPVLDLEIRARPEIQADDLRGALAHAGGYVIAGDDEVLAALVAATHQDMRVRMAGVVMIDRHPIELGTEIFLHAVHQAAGERLEVVVFRAVLGRDDEAELMAVALGTLQEGFSVRPVLLGAVKLTRLALAGHAVALDIPQMGPRIFHSLGHPLAGQLDDAGFDDDAALAEGCVTVSVRQHAPDACAAPDAAAGEAGLACAARSAAREV